MLDGAIFYDPTKYEDLRAWHATAAAIRRDTPVLRVEPPGLAPFWAVTRHAHVMEIERQPERFWNTKQVVLDPSGGIERLRASGADLKTLVHMDGAEHRGYRAVTNDWFKPANLRRLFEARIAELSRTFVDRMAALDGACDFATDIALYYPLRVIMSILGVPEEDEPLMLRLTQGVFGAEDPELGGSDAQATMAAALTDLATYFQRVTADRRARPTDDLASTIANGTIDGQLVGDLQTISYYAIVATAGHDTTSSSLAGGLEALIRHPEQLRALRDDPRRIDNAVEEIIRWVTPVRHFMRWPQEDAVIGGVSIRKGERLLLSYLSANHDETVFPDPFRFDIERRNASDHLAFGIGVHFCLGAHLARMELRAFLRELLPRLESIELAAEPTYASTTFVGGPKHVPIRYRLR
ncbi:MAG TPA: cytochrome P450 [Candidatus Binatia bacterium]|jgi:cytochrome P450